VQFAAQNLQICQKFHPRAQDAYTLESVAIKRFSVWYLDVLVFTVTGKSFFNIFVGLEIGAPWALTTLPTAYCFPLAAAAAAIG